MTTTRNIVCGFLIVSYLAVCTGAVVGLITPSPTSAGPAAIAMHAGKTKDAPAVSFTQRRHIPLVKPIVLPDDSECPAEYPVEKAPRVTVRRDSQAVSYLSLYFRSISDRAPPSC